MPKFAFIYRGGNHPGTPEEGQVLMADWRKWAEGLGEAFVYPGFPCSSAKTVSSDGVSEGSGSPSVSGISVVEAENLEAAVAMAKTCPHLGIGGDMVVAEGMDMEM